MIILRQKEFGNKQNKILKNRFEINNGIKHLDNNFGNIHVSDKPSKIVKGIEDISKQAFRTLQKSVIYNPNKKWSYVDTRINLRQNNIGNYLKNNPGYNLPDFARTSINKNTIKSIPSNF